MRKINQPSISLSGNEFAGYSKTLAGYDVGGGVEYAFNSNWTGRVEYRYYNFGSTHGYYGGTGVNGYNTTLTDNTVRLGLVYKFGAAEPVVAKY